jgi:hypothetical protein
MKIRRSIVALGVAVLFVSLVAPAQAQWGRRGTSMTPFGPMPGGVDMGSYQNMLLQRQMMQMQQQQAKQDQAVLKQMQQQAQAQAKKDKGKTDDKSKADDASKNVKRPLTLEERRKLERERLDAARAKLGLDKSKEAEATKDEGEADKPVKPSASATKVVTPKGAKE